MTKKKNTLIYVQIDFYYTMTYSHYDSTVFNSRVISVYYLRTHTHTHTQAQTSNLLFQQKWNEASSYVNYNISTEFLSVKIKRIKLLKKKQTRHNEK